MFFLSLVLLAARGYSQNESVYAKIIEDDLKKK
jgi:hypothetical protein